MDSNAHMDFALIKHGKKKAVYDYMLEGVTKNTFGLYIYQEQIMQAVNVLGRLTLVEADEVRTIMKKFDEKGMIAFEKKFLVGAIKNGCKPDEAKKIWKKLLAFSGYGFNRSHSAAYSLMSYWSQWLKANYPLEFWTASLQHSRDEEEIPNRISELNKLDLGITIKSPDVNKSGEFFALDKQANSIYWSISKIKGVGKIAVDNILAVREQSGMFFSFEEFLARVPKQKVNKTIVTRLILAGCFDELENIVEQSGRKELLIDYYKSIKSDIPTEYTTKESDRNTFWILLQKEFTGHGDINYKDLLMKQSKDKRFNNKYIDGLDFLNSKKDWREGTICGRVLFMIERNSKKGKFGAITIEHNNNLIQIVLWNEIYKKYKEQLETIKGKLIAVDGKIKFDTWRGCNVMYSEDETKLIEL
jgi:DNA polymerase III alpha subunit